MPAEWLFYNMLDLNSEEAHNSYMMIDKEKMMTDFEKNCYGMTEAEIREEYMNSLTAKLSGLEMVIMGVLSDAQELMSMGGYNQARQNMNIAKFMLSEMMDEKRQERKAA